jgi:hypothetical protein
LGVRGLKMTSNRLPDSHAWRMIEQPAGGHNKKRQINGGGQIPCHDNHNG